MIYNASLNTDYLAMTIKILNDSEYITWNLGESKYSKSNEKWVFIAIIDLYSTTEHEGNPLPFLSPILIMFNQ